MEKQIERAKEMCKHNKVKRISDTFWEVDKNNVALRVKQGRQLLTCSCENSGRFENIQMCIHKIAVIVFETNKDFNKKIDKLINDYKTIKDLKLKTDIDIIINDLEELKNGN
jgi:hypothetical protein